MIQFEPKTRSQKEYHRIDMDSSTTLKDFSLDRKKYYKKYMIGEEVEEEDSVSTLLGRMVETLALEAEDFDKRFYMSICPDPPKKGTNMYEFCHALYREAILCLNEDGVVTKGFEQMAIDAREAAGYSKTWDLARVLGEFNKGPKLYYQEMIESRPKGLHVVSTEMRDTSQRVVDALFNDQGKVGEVMNLRDSKRYRVFHQLQIEGFYIDGLKMKCMIDKLVIDLQEKTIQIYDLKCVWNVEDFYTAYYLKRRAYIQGFVYASALRSEACNLGLDICDFEVLPPAFIVCDSVNYYSPLIYQMTDRDLIEAYDGFTYRNYSYPGVKEIIPALQWAKEKDIWTTSMENEARGRILTIQDCKNQL